MIAAYVVNYVFVKQYYQWGKKREEVEMAWDGPLVLFLCRF